MEENYFEKKIFLVTGAGSGLGYETSKILLQGNAIVFAMIRDPSSMKSLRADYEKSLYLFQGDVSRQKDCEKYVQTALKKYKHIHGIIHCAGVGLRSYAKDLDNEVFERIMRTNFFSLVYLYKAARAEIEKKHGHFVAVSSIQGLIAVPYRAAYSASKHALNAYVNCIRAEDKNIHFLCVNFGYIRTNFSFNALDGRGGKYGKNSKGQIKGMDSVRAAQMMIDAMIKRKREITPAGFREKLALQIHRFFPFLYHRLIFRYGQLE
ncbi:MAG: SDR family NAD(P)-dependent oxidoreductase [Spirochaetia bacterium]|nr:SDR family NAD(P)-dependent oxidoreductase [Spirochaetia bacterium]